MKIKGLLDRYRPLLLILLFLGTCLIADAQRYTVINTYGYEWQRGRFNTALGIPNDTLMVDASQRNYPHIAEKNGYLYLWSPTLNRWMPAGGGEGGGVDTTNLSNRINFKLNISDTSSMLFPYVRKSAMANYLAPYLLAEDTASLSSRIDAISDKYYKNYFVTGAQYKSLYGVDQDGITRLLASWQDLIGDSSGANTTAYVDSLWKDGNDLKWSKGGNEYTITEVGGGTQTPGTSYNRYSELFIGVANGQFTVSKSPVSGRMDVYINGVKIPRNSFTINVNTVLINTSFLGYTISPADDIEIVYESTL